MRKSTKRIDISLPTNVRKDCVLGAERMITVSILVQGIMIPPAHCPRMTNGANIRHRQKLRWVSARRRIM